MNVEILISQRNLCTLPYYAFEDFQLSYYNMETSEPLLGICSFRDFPHFVIDCLHLPEVMKSSVVCAFPLNTKRYALIRQETCLTKNALYCRLKLTVVSFLIFILKCMR